MQSASLWIALASNPVEKRQAEEESLSRNRIVPCGNDSVFRTQRTRASPRCSRQTLRKSSSRSIKPPGESRRMATSAKDWRSFQAFQVAYVSPAGTSLPRFTLPRERNWSNGAAKRCRRQAGDCSARWWWSWEAGYEGSRLRQRAGRSVSPDR